jgi:hypothetical protein
MPLTPEQRQRVLEAITSGRLRLDRPTKMYAGFGAGRTCDGCGEAIDKTQVEHEAVYEDGSGDGGVGQALHLHLGCAGLWDVERRRPAQRGEESGSPIPGWPTAPGSLKRHEPERNEA